MERKRIVITGMATINPIATSLSEFYENLMAGKSGIRRWTSADTSRIAPKIGGDLRDRDWLPQRDRVMETLDAATAKRLRKLWRTAPFSARLALLTTLEAYDDAGIWQHPVEDPYRIGCLVGGHNFNMRYVLDNYRTFQEEPEFIDPLLAMTGLDTDIAGSITDILRSNGPAFTLGGACASTNLALREAMRELREDTVDVALVVGAPYDVDMLDLQAMDLMNSVSVKSFNDEPEKASRPYDVDREGFVVSHGAATLVLESLDRAVGRGAKIYAEVLSANANSSATHLPQPSPASQARAMADALKQANLEPEDIDFVSAHATSTPLGDLTEVEAIEIVFGEHTKKLKVNAPKSMLGHCCWAAPAVESIAAILQMNANRLHRSINIATLDPRVTLDVCADGPKDHRITHFLKNSFGFGGVNCCSVFKKYTGPGSVISTG